MIAGGKPFFGMIAGEILGTCSIMADMCCLACFLSLLFLCFLCFVKHCGGFSNENQQGSPFDKKNVGGGGAIT
jgi:hypothetical protein